MNKFSDIPIKITLRACILFEKMTGRSFYTCNDNDAAILAYCCFQAAPGVEKITYNDFLSLLENRKFEEWLLRSIKADEEFNAQFAPTTEEKSEGKADDTPPMLTDIAAVMVINGVDAKYVMDEMPLYELQGYITAIEERKKEMVTNDRLWTWLGLMPHLSKESSRKLSSPDKLLPFPWEIDEKKKKSEKEFDSMKNSLAEFFKAQESKIKQESNG